jgi:hypothetical protein
MHLARTSTRTVAAGSVVAALALLLQGSALTAGASPAEGSQTGRSLTFDVLFSPFDYTDLGQPGPSSADVIVFHDSLQQGGVSVGDEVGSCTLVGAEGLGSCTGVLRLGERGTITFAFVNAPPPHKVIAVTGGSGQFRAVRGDGTLDEKGDGTGTLVLRILR